MSRPIKYRAWDKKYHKMIGLGDVRDMFSLRSDGKPSNENYKLMQWTGLLDVNGKEIYEGDLVKKHGQDSPIYQMVWSENAVGFALELEGPPHDSEWPGFLELEVVGNIWENGEFINEPK